MAGRSSTDRNIPVSNNTGPPGGPPDTRSTNSDESVGNKASRMLSTAGRNIMLVMTGSPTKAGRKRKANEATGMSPEKTKNRASRQDHRPSTPTPTNIQTSNTLFDEDMYSEETTTIDNLSVFNRPATLTEEQVINNIAVSLEDTINLARAAKEAGFDSANEKTSKQMEALLATLHDISGKMDIMEERLTQKLQKRAEETEERLTRTIHEMKIHAEENIYRMNKRIQWIEEGDKHKDPNKTEPPTKAPNKATTQALDNNTNNIKTPNTNYNKDVAKPTPTNPTAAHHPSRAIIAYQQNIPESKRRPPADICETLNKALTEIHKEKKIQIVAARYTQHGNIIINTRADQNAADFVKIADAVIPCLHPGIAATARVDVKWYKIQVDGISTRRATIGGEIHTHSTETIHEELTKCNPGYGAIAHHIITKPRWLRTADELQLIPYSSVVFAVDDEEAAKSLLRNGKLAAFGRYCTLRPFQDRPPVIQCSNCWGWEHRETTCKIRRRCRLCSEAHAEGEHPNRGPCDGCRQQIEQAGDTVMDDEECTHRLKCANCALEGRDDHHHKADNRRCPARIEKWGTARANEKKAIKNNEPWTVVKSKAKPRKKSKEDGKKPISEKTNTILSQNTFSPLETLNNTQTDLNNNTIQTN
ncbi:hypothetical protein D9619_007716 [Psilocybe cf. subviscida]|uniref:Uncharacterized protein n=1 Tax=Psilocybe cf. subviscida TaxID=2480587 RepID=A0A8H5AU64_9AGAR|nr:hypothetical protein D9619_007716 [Psilocybe cf. subviscida]